jgi:hypothetical protein
LYCLNLYPFLFYYIVEHFLPSFFKKHREIRQQISHKQIRNRLNNHSSFIKSIALILIPVLIISLIGTLSIGQTTSQTQRKPLLAYSKGNYYVWYQNSSERVTKNYLALVDDSSPVNNEVELKLAKNEYAAFQLVWRPLGVAIESFNYSISDFTHDDNPSSIISSECCSLRYVDYIIDDEFPDVLMPFTELEMKNNENYVLWFSIRVPYTALAGNYSGRLIFSFNHGLSEEIKINLRIWNFAIPYEKHLSTNIAAASDTSLDTIQNFVDHRINNYGVRIYVTYNITLLETREIYTCHLDKSTGAWKFNWTWWDNLTQYRLDQGMNALRINYPLGIADGRVPYIDNETRMEWLDSWFRSVEKHLIDIGWLDYAYYYFIDEFQMFIPSEYSSRESYFQDLKVLLQAMKEAAPKLKIMATAPPSEELEDLKDYIDIYCPVSYDRDKERWDERLDAGCEFWMYACVGPLAPYPNSHLYNRLYECRILIWQVWLYKLHGFLYWQSQAYYHGQYGLGFNGWGDAWFIYQRGNSLYDTLRWENYLEGLEDYEYLWLLNATLNCLEENPGAISTEKLSSYREELDSIVDSIVGEKWIYCDNPSTLYAGRDRIGAILHELSSLALIESIAEAPWYPPYKPGT